MFNLKDLIRHKKISAVQICWHRGAQIKIFLKPPSAQVNLKATTELFLNVINCIVGVRF